MEKIYELLLDLQWIVSKDERSKTMINLPCKQATFWIYDTGGMGIYVDLYWLERVESDFELWREWTRW